MYLNLLINGNIYIYIYNSHLFQQYAELKKFSSNSLTKECALNISIH
jgi:hypothetical protein